MLKEGLSRCDCNRGGVRDASILDQGLSVWFSQVAVRQQVHAAVVSVSKRKHRPALEGKHQLHVGFTRHLQHALRVSETEQTHSVAGGSDLEELVHD